jgi:group I intron endonuclease
LRCYSSEVGLGSGISNSSIKVTPVVIYDNAHENKKIAIKSNRKKSGVYRWVHIKSGKMYIGSSIDLGRRFSSYFSLKLIENQAKRSIIYKSLIKYGHLEFRLEILEFCNSEDVIEREQFYLDALKPEYNILKIAGSRTGFKVLDETKAKIRAALTGRVLSESVKAKIKAARIGAKHSEATRAKLKEHLVTLNKKVLAEKNGIKVTILDLETKVFTEYSSIRKAAKGIGSYGDKIVKYENLKLSKNYTKPFKGRYEINIFRK